MKIEQREVILEKFKIGAELALSDELINAKGTYWFDEANELLCFQVRGFILSEHLDSVSVKYPKDWWQAFKEKFFTKWLLKKYPVQYTKRVFDVKVLYPNYRPAMYDQPYKVIIAEVNWQQANNTLTQHPY